MIFCNADFYEYYNRFQVKKEIGIGIIGTGRHGSRYVRHLLADIDGFSLKGVSRRSPAGKLQADEWGVPYFQDWRELVAEGKVQAVIAVTTPDLNEAIGMACVEAGKPLLVEKPLAIDATAGQRMVDAFDKVGLILTVGQTLRYNTVILALKKELSSLGTLFSFAAHQRLEPTLHPWLDNPAVAGGGVILHTAVHMFDALRFITGREVCRVRASMFNRFNENLEDLFTAQLEMDGGLVGVVDAGKVGLGRSGRYEFIGETGQLQADQVHHVMQKIAGSQVKDQDLPEERSTIIHLLNDWLACLRGEAPNPIPGNEGLAALRICDACRLSAVKDDWVKIDEIVKNTISPRIAPVTY